MREIYSGVMIAAFSKMVDTDKTVFERSGRRGGIR